MLRRAKTAWIALATLALAVTYLPGAAAALATYEYRGYGFTEFEDRDPPEGSYDSSMSVTGYFTLAAPLAPDLPLTDLTFDVLDARWNDGRQSVTRLESIQVGTDAPGQIDEWQVDAWEFILQGTSIIECRNIFTTTLGQSHEDTGQIFSGNCFSGPFPVKDSGTTRNSEGTWTLVPEPSTALLTGLGLTLLALTTRSRATAGRASPAWWAAAS